MNIKSRVCGTDLNNNNLLTLHGERYKTNMRKEEQSWLSFASKLSSTTVEFPVVTIPVVVHVVYNKKDQNILDSRIHSQLEVLNADYRKRNLDKNKVPDVWKEIAGDSRIEFMLASRDPEGNPTNGITRTKTAIKRFIHGTDENDKPLPEKIKSTSQGGKDPWDTTRYLNLWVCNLIEMESGQNSPGQLLGYAQFPSGPPETDGVVIFYEAFGMNKKIPSFGLGRTCTHEVGHWLGLRHIWGDDYDPSNPNSPLGCSRSDNITDTPNQRGPNNGKPQFPTNEQSCPNTGANGTMFMNYMDYSDDDSLYMFTIGQVAKMRSTLKGSRSTITASNVLISHKEEAHLETLRTLPSKVYDGSHSVVAIEELL